MPSRQVIIYELKLINYAYPVLKLEAKVSSGTYIRSLAQDLGGLLKTGAYLSGLVRTEVGEFKLSEALQLDGIAKEQVANNLRQ